MALIRATLYLSNGKTVTVLGTGNHSQNAGVTTIISGLCQNAGVQVLSCLKELKRMVLRTEDSMVAGWVSPSLHVSMSLVVATAMDLMMNGPRWPHHPRSSQVLLETAKRCLTVSCFSTERCE